MCIAVTARGQVFDTELSDLTGFRTKIRDIDNDESLRHFRVEQGKNKMGGTKAAVLYFHIVGKRELLQLFSYSGSEPVIGKQGVSTPYNHDLWIQHLCTLTR